MNKTLLLLMMSFLTTSLIAQQLVSMGTGYNEQVFYSLSDSSYVNIGNDEWDIAFSTIGLQDAGVHINEAAGFSRGSTTPELQVYATDAAWDEAIIPDSLTDRLYNDEKSWTYGGAFNQNRDLTDPFDFGWGSYDFNTNLVTGDQVYAIKLRNGNWIKFMIDGINITTYTFRYADLDGSNEKSISFDKEDYLGSMAYFSFTTGSFLDKIPVKWDIMFTRYSTKINAGGTLTPYVVAGALTNHGIKATGAQNIDPETITISDYIDSLSSDNDAIGYQWKEFNAGWVVYDDQAYFLKDPDDNYWKIYFTYFGGSSDGSIIFNQKQMPVSQTNDNDLIRKMSIAPNPAHQSTQIVFDWNQSATPLSCQLLNTQGQIMRNYRFEAQQGLNAFTLRNLPKTPGIYLLKITDGYNSSLHKLLIN